MMENAEVKIKQNVTDLRIATDVVGLQGNCQGTLKTSYPLIMIHGSLEVRSKNGPNLCIEFRKNNHKELEKNGDDEKGTDLCNMVMEGKVKKQKVLHETNELVQSLCQANKRGYSCENDVTERSRTNLGYIRCHSLSTDHELNWLISDSGEMRIFTPAKKGRNLILLSSTETKNVFHELHVEYEPIKNERFVRPVYIICSGSNGKFQAPAEVDNSIESALQRIAFNARILQTFTGENLNLHGFGRRSFRLEEDEEGNVKVSVFQSKLTVEKAHTMTGDELYRFFKEELSNSELFNPLCKFWVFMSCTFYKPPENKDTFDKKKIPEYVRGHTALGGGNLALFGTGCLHTWARNLNELVEKFTDEKKIDAHCLFDDSCNRGFHWANYSTTLGAAMHELGHTFNLPHTSSGIMGRGFDDMNCFFTTRNYPNSVSKTELINSPYESFGAHWHRSSAAVLNHCKWIGNREIETRNDTSLPVMSLGLNEIGPVGGGNREDESHVKFNLKTWLNDENVEFQGLRIKAGEFVDAIQFTGIKRDDQSSDVSSPWYGNESGDGRINKFRLNSKDEKLTAIDVRAGEWIDALRIHTTHQSSVWFGGNGGDLYKMEPLNVNSKIDGIFGTAANFVTSLGLTTTSSSDDELDKQELSLDDRVYFKSPNGIRVVEAQCKLSEVIKHWEFIEEKPQNFIAIQKDELLCDGKTVTIEVYDGEGGKASFKLRNFVSR